MPSTCLLLLNLVGFRYELKFLEGLLHIYVGTDLKGSMISPKYTDYSGLSCLGHQFFGCEVFVCTENDLAGQAK